MTGKTLPVLKKDVFPFSQFISLFIVLKAISAFSHLTTILLFPLLGVSHPHYLHSECPPISHEQSFLAELLTSSWPPYCHFQGTQSCRHCRQACLHTRPGAPPACDLPRETFFLKIIYLCIYFQKGRRERRRETSPCGCLSCAPHWGPDLQPRHVP